MYKKILVLLLFTQTISANELFFNYEGYFSSTYQNYSQSTLNPGNEIYQQPHTIYSSDQRIDLKWEIHDAKVIVRPRLIYDYKLIMTDINDQNYTADKSRLDLTDFFYEQQLNDTQFVTVGLQVYQWGPTELINVTNPIYHYSFAQKNLVYKEKGQILLRYNYSLNEENNLVILLQPFSNNDPHWITDEDFKQQALFKYEKLWLNTRNFLGLVSGHADDSDLFIGEYFQYEFSEGMTFYGDLKHSQNKRYYYPVPNEPVVRFEKTDFDGIFTSLANLGLRYEGAYDFRLEYIYNSAGYDQSEYNLALQALSQTTSPYYFSNIKRFNKSGLEFLTKHYLYLSIRKSDALNIQDLNLFARYFTSLLDQSSVSQLEFDYNILDNMNIFGNSSLFNGDTDAELTLLNDYQMSAGFKLIY